METWVRDREDEDGPGTLLAGALWAVVGALLWVLIILAVRWVLQLPPPALVRLGAVVLLFAGTGLVFGALIQMELTIRPPVDSRRGRRPSATPRPTRADALTPPPAGGAGLHMVGSAAGATRATRTREEP
jgi:hypothetical protein